MFKKIKSAVTTAAKSPYYRTIVGIGAAAAIGAGIYYAIKSGATEAVGEAIAEAGEAAVDTVSQ